MEKLQHLSTYKGNAQTKNSPAMKKNRMIFKLNKLNEYSSTLSKDHKFNAIGYFLEEACIFLTPEYIEWLKFASDPGDEKGYNYCRLRLENDNFVSAIFDAYKDEKIFTTSKEQLLAILTEWNKIINMKPMPNEVHLLQDGDKVWLEIKN